MYINPLFSRHWKCKYFEGNLFYQRIYNVIYSVRRKICLSCFLWVSTAMTEGMKERGVNGTLKYASINFCLNQSVVLVKASYPSVRVWVRRQHPSLTTHSKRQLHGLLYLYLIFPFELDQHYSSLLQEAPWLKLLPPPVFYFLTND